MFHEFSTTYGQGFMRQYDGVDPDEVKANWAEKLASFRDAPDAIRYALDNLPADRAPTVLQFKELCRRAPDVAFPRLAALPAPANDEPVAPEVAAKVRDVLRSRPGRDQKQWARDLRERERNGPGLTPFQRAAWREALGGEA